MGDTLRRTQQPGSRAEPSPERRLTGAARPGRLTLLQAGPGALGVCRPRPTSPRPRPTSPRPRPAQAPPRFRPGPVGPVPSRPAHSSLGHLCALSCCVLLPLWSWLVPCPFRAEELLVVRWGHKVAQVGWIFDSQHWQRLGTPRTWIRSEVPPPPHDSTP
jgi:hypothetical protein